MNWFKWFAWYPVPIFFNDMGNHQPHWSHRWTWLRFVEKKRCYKTGLMYKKPIGWTEYREIGSNWA